jgi:3',5'-cyclic AMP phosphodiesterase CpdA
VGFLGLNVDEPQRWVEATLASSEARFKVIVAHHPLAGAAADDANSAYGRGGAAAAHLGSQSKLHRVMLRHGVQAFIHGHDHVFYDQVLFGSITECRARRVMEHSPESAAH